MTRILIIGNSHVATLRAGMDLLQDRLRPPVDISYFGSPSQTFIRLGFDGTRFGETAQSDLSAEERAAILRVGGATSVDLETFDEILLTGMVWAGTNEIVSLLSYFSIDGLYEVEGRQRLTMAAFQAMLKGAFTAVQIDPGWTRLKRPRLSLLLRPMPVDLVRHLAEDQTGYPIPWASDRIVMAKARPALDLQRSLAERYYAERGIHLMHQPEPTLQPDGLTRNAFGRDRLDRAATPGAKVDVAHLNAEFGRLVMTAYLERIAPAMLSHPEEALSNVGS